MAENVRVIVRCRPMNQRENNMGCKNVVKIEKCVVDLENATEPTAPSKTFTYDAAYDLKTSTEAIYNDICYSLVENVLEGYNGTIFAYGQTGCGKSHTMQGPDDLPTNPTSAQLTQRGIIPRSFDHIFESISVITGRRYLALVSYLEIYNENIRDLLSPGTASSTLILKEQTNEGIIVQNLSSHAVHNAKECEQLLEIGTKNRMVGATLMNAGSSRSHSIFTINLEQISTACGHDELNEEPSIKKGKLNLVDLAGSERQAKTGATGERLKEATKINLSLSALGNVISALVDGKTKHIPYRDSKLTRMLQDSLGGNTKTLMIACISPAAFNYDETLSTLRYASRAKNISNKPKINEDPKDAMLREYQAEITRLKQQLEMGGSITNGTTEIGLSDSWLDAEKVKLSRGFEDEVARLKVEHDAQRKEKEDLAKDMEQLKEHYEQQLRDLAINNKNSSRTNSTEKDKDEVINKIKMLKSALIGGECANDTQFKEKLKKRKMESERRLSALANALSRVEQTEDRDILQMHYSDIQQELKIKTDALKANRQKVRALEREVSDLQSEFQLDRSDYLDTIRRLEKNLKFFQQFIEKTVPVLRKEGRYWDPDAIKSNSVWLDDLNKWKLPEDAMTRLKLPPAECRDPNDSADDIVEDLTSSANTTITHNFETDMYLEKLNQDNEKKLERSDGNDIVGSYFRPRRAAELIHQNKVVNCWKDFASRNTKPATTWATPSNHLRNSTVVIGGNAGGGGGIVGGANNQLPWQTIAALNASNGSLNNNNIYNKLLYGIRPTQNGTLNKLLNSPKKYVYKTEHFHESGIMSTPRPMAAAIHNTRDGHFPRQ